MAVSEDVMKLVRTVERLPREDQEKIMRIVDLLSLVPISVQDKTQQMLRDLLARGPTSKHECVAGVDDVLDYLERNVTISKDVRGSSSRFGYALGAKMRLS